MIIGKSSITLFKLVVWLNFLWQFLKNNFSSNIFETRFAKHDKYGRLSLTENLLRNTFHGSTGIMEFRI